MAKTQYIPKGPYDLQIIKIADIDVWHEANARHTNIMEDIEELADSIDSIGLQNPPLGQKANGKYLLISGQRRLKAFEYLGEKRIPLLILKHPYDIQRAKLASVIENLHRKEMNAKDIAEACNFLKQKLGTNKKAAKALGISPQTFAKYLGFKAASKELKGMVSDKKISVQDAKRITQIATSNVKAIEFAKIISKLPKKSKDRYFTALMDEPNAPKEIIRSKANRLKYKDKITIHLPQTYALALGRASEDRELEPEAVAQDAVIEWLKRHGYAKAR